MKCWIAWPTLWMNIRIRPWTSPTPPWSRWPNRKTFGVFSRWILTFTHTDCAAAASWRWCQRDDRAQQHCSQSKPVSPQDVHLEVIGKRTLALASIVVIILIVLILIT